MYDSTITRMENVPEDWKCIISMFLTSCIIYFVFGYACRGRTREAQFPGRQITIGAPKSLNNVTSTFFNTVLLLPKYFRFKHGCAKLASCPGSHLASLRPCMHVLCECVFKTAIWYFGTRSVFWAKTEWHLS